MFGTMFKKGKTSEVSEGLKEALGKENWNASNSVLQELALATEDDANRQEIMDSVWKVMDDGKHWRRVLKSLALCEVVLKRGSVRAVEDVQNNVHRIQRWQSHQQQEDGRDVAGGIREKASTIVALVSDPKRLNQERQKNYEMQAKMQGVGTAVRESQSVTERAANSAQKLKNGVTGNHDAKLARETLKHQKEVRVLLTVQEFVEKTGAPDHMARHFLGRHRGNMQAAIAEYNSEQHKAGGVTPRGGAAPQARQPPLAEARAMCEQVKMITEVSDVKAMEILKQCGWDVEKAIDKASRESHAKQPESESDSDSDSDSSDDEPQVRNRGGQGWPATQQTTTPRGGQQPGWGFGGQQGFGGNQGNQNGGFNGNSFGGPNAGAPGGFGGQQRSQQGLSANQGNQQNWGGQQGNQQGGWGGQQGNQQGGWAGTRGEQGGWGGNPGCNQQGPWGNQQNGGFGGEQNSQKFGGQQGNFQNQQGLACKSAGFNNQQGGYGGAQGNVASHQGNFGGHGAFGGGNFGNTRDFQNQSQVGRPNNYNGW